MPTNKRQTSYRHDDYKVQREFERLHNDLYRVEKASEAVPVSSGGQSSVQTKPDSYRNPNIITATGVVYVNQLPLDPAGRNYTTHPSPDYDYIFNHYEYTVANGFYGWYVYGIINHNLRLENRDMYFLQLVNLRRWQDYSADAFETGEEFIHGEPFDITRMATDKLIDMNGDDVTAAIDAQIFDALHFENQATYVQHEGLNADQIILHGIYKPDLNYYFGVKGEQLLYYIDEPNRIVKTNIAFKWMVQKRIKEI